MRRQEQAEASRSRLLAVARECFVEHGYEATTVAAILAGAGMARGALYHYFPGGKEEIFAAVYRDLDDLLHREFETLAALPSPLAALRASFAIYFRLCCREDFSRITVREAPRVIDGAEWPRRDGSQGRSFRRLHEQVSATVAAGEVTGVDVEALATGLYGAARDLGAQVAVAPDRQQAAKAAQAVMDRLLDGLTATSPAGPADGGNPAAPSHRRDPAGQVLKEAHR